MIAPSLIVALIVGGVWVVLFWKAAEMDGQPGWLWAGLSAVVFAVAFFILGWGWLGISVGQIILGVSIAVVRALLEARGK